MGNQMGMIEMGVRKGSAAYVVTHEESYQQWLQPFYATQNAHFFYQQRRKCTKRMKQKAKIVCSIAKKLQRA